MKTIIGFVLSASLIASIAPQIVADSSHHTEQAAKQTAKETAKAAPQTVLVHPKLKGAEGAGWVKVTIKPATPAPTPAPGTCLPPRRISLKGAVGYYARDQKLLRCNKSTSCSSGQCDKHMTCAGVAK